MSLTAHRVGVFQRAGNVTGSLIVKMDQMNRTLVVSARFIHCILYLSFVFDITYMYDLK